MVVFLTTFCYKFRTLHLLVVGPEGAGGVLGAVVAAVLLVGTVVADLVAVGYVDGGVDSLALNGAVVPGN